MRLRHLHINNFGRFQDQAIELSDAGLQLIFGPNEAGKTTLLEFLRGWLFDFPPRTPYDFKAGMEVSGFGTLTLGDGRTVELRRRKGTKNKVAIRIDGLDTDLDEPGLRRLLGNADRNLFETVFAFGLDELAKGVETLKDESLQAALYGGGLGMPINPEQIVKSLGERACKIFNAAPRSKSIVTGLLGELRELTDQIKKQSLKSDEYVRRHGAVAESQARAAELQQQVETLRRAHKRLSRLSDAWPKWCELQLLRKERQPLAAPAKLPPDAGHRYQLVSERIQQTTDEVAKLEIEIGRFERDLNSLELEPAIASCQAEILDCLELKKSYSEACRDLPERVRQRDQTKREIENELCELRPGWSADDLRSFNVDAATRNELSRLAAEYQQQRTELAKLQTAQEDIESELRLEHDELALLGEPLDVSSLATLFEEETAYVRNKTQHDNCKRELAKLDRHWDVCCRKLTPPLASALATPPSLPVPRLETVAQFELDFADCREQLKAATASLEEDIDELARLVEKQNDEHERREVPDLQARAAARERRNEGWRLIRSRYIEGQPFPEEERKWLAGAHSLADAFESSIQDADTIADRIYDNADSVAKREELRRQCEKKSRKVDQKRAAIEKLRTLQGDLLQRWNSLWAPCGFEPLAPDAMRHWLGDYAAVCELSQKRADCESDLRDCASRMSNFERRLRDASGRMEADFDSLIAAARKTVEDARNQSRRIDELRSVIRRREKSLADNAKKLQTNAQRQCVWRSEWQRLMEQLKFPANWHTELAREIMDRLGATRVKLDKIPEIEGRIALMQERIAQFESKVRTVCQTLEPSMLEMPPELAVEKLSEQSEKAIAAQRKHEQLSEQLARSRDQLKQVITRRDSAHADRQDLFQAAEADNEASFLATVERAKNIRDLEVEIEQLNRQLELIRGTDDPIAFEETLNSVEPGVLEGQLRDADASLQQAERQLRDADGEAAVAKSELARLDGSAEVAVLLERQSNKRAELAAEIDNYVPVLLAKDFLEKAVRKFERNNRPEMIASVSKLFEEMTGGRYVEFDRIGSDTKEIVVRRKDGTELRPAQLSCGTREQLYLAIRLAYVLHYCHQSEPLPIIMDDVLVNFDDDRVRQTMTALTGVASKVQVLFFTCHAHMVALAKDVVPTISPIELSNG